MTQPSDGHAPASPALVTEDEVRALVDRRDDPALRERAAEVLASVVRWRWTDDDVVLTQAPFAWELETEDPYPVPEWQDTPPKRKADWSEYGFDIGGQIVAYRWRITGDREPTVAVRWREEREIVEIAPVGDGPIARLEVDTFDEQGRVVRRAVVTGERGMTDEFPVERADVECSDYSHADGRPIGLARSRWSHTRVELPAHLSAAERAAEPWSKLAAMHDHAERFFEPEMIRAEYDGDTLVRLVRRFSGEESDVWAGARAEPRTPKPLPVPEGTPLAELEDAFAAALANAIAADAAAHPVDGPLLRAIVRWFDVADPSYLTVHLLGAGEADDTTHGDEAWLPLEWTNADREFERTERLVDDAAWREAAARLVEPYEDMVSAGLGDEGPGFGVSRAIWETIRQLPAAFERHGVELDPHFAATAAHFEAVGGLDVLRDTASPAALAALEAAGELPWE